MHTASTRSAGHLLGAIGVGCPEYEETRCNDGMQLRINLIEHDEKEADDEGIVIELSNEDRMSNDRFFPGFPLGQTSVRNLNEDG